MSSTFTFCDPVDFFAFLIGLGLLVEKVSKLDRYQSLRTPGMTIIFSVIPIYFFLLWIFGPYNCWEGWSCMLDPE